MSQSRETQVAVALSGHSPRAGEIQAWLIDMDGVIVREEQPIDGASRFLSRLRERETPFLILTNNSIFTPGDLARRLQRDGIEVAQDRIWTSALATARFLEAQRPGGWRS
ncbi:MAG: hypothetical protein WB770_01850 [Acidimicrobiales bacterium]